MVEVNPRVRAEHLGSSALTVRVRCACGRKHDFDREGWSFYRIAICTACHCGILYDSFQIVTPAEAQRMITEHSTAEEELKALRGIELVMRDFLAKYDEKPQWLWSAQTTRVADKLRPLFEALDELREGHAEDPGEEMDEGPEEELETQDDEETLTSAEDERDIADAD